MKSGIRKDEQNSFKRMVEEGASVKDCAKAFNIDPKKAAGWVKHFGGVKMPTESIPDEVPMVPKATPKATPKAALREDKEEE